MAKDKVKRDQLARKIAQCERQMAHLESEKVKIQALIDDPDNTDDAELETELDELNQSLANHAAKLAKLTGSTPPAP